MLICTIIWRCKLNYNKFSEAGFNVSALLSAGIKSAQGCFMLDFDSTKGIEEKDDLVQNYTLEPIKALENVKLSIFSKPVDGIDYILPERESWMSPLTLLTDLLLVNILISNLDRLKKSTDELQSAMILKSKIKACLLANDHQYHAGFSLLFAHKPLCKAIIDAFWAIPEHSEILIDHNKRLSATVLNQIVSSNNVKTELRKIAGLFKMHAKDIGASLKALEEYTVLENA